MRPVVIVGAGGFGREVLEIFKAQNRTSQDWIVQGFIDENRDLHGSVINGCPVLGGLEWVRARDNSGLGCVVAIGICETRKQVVEKLQKTGIAFYNAIHPSVIMSEFVQLGQGVIICAGSILTVNIVIGDHVHVDTNCTIAHDAVIESYCRLNSGVRVNGNDHLGEGLYVGSGATFVQQVSAGSWSVIGAGAVVVGDIPERVVAVGVPAKVVKLRG